MSESNAVLDIEELRSALEAIAVPEDAEPMARYMKDHFEFLGIRTPPRKAAAKPTMQAGKHASGDELIAFARECWACDEREFQYVACELLRKYVKKLESRHLSDVEYLIRTKSWWDSVDGLAANCVGALVRADEALAQTMDRWVKSDDMWIARTAMLHQLTYKGDTDAGRLFDYALYLSGETEFFIRKSIGWALRQYAYVDPDAIASFVHEHEDKLSGLTKREALKHIT